MSLEEAIEWLRGNRSWHNDVQCEDSAMWTVRREQADAAATEKAYWIVKAHKEGLLTK